MSAQRFLYYYLWIAPHVILLAVAFLLVRRRLQRELPFFLAYVIFEIVQFVVMFYVIHATWTTNEQYFYVYLAGFACSMALRFGVIYDIVNYLFREYPALGQLGSKLLRWTAALLLLIAVGTAAYSSREGVHLVARLWLVPDRAVSVMQCGLVVLLFVFSKHFGITWRNYVFGIALGMGLRAAFDLGYSAVRIWLGPDYAATTFNMLDNGVYHCAVLVWLGYLLAREPVARRVVPLPANDLEKWNRELERLLQR
jgi:hypothetical protein